MASQAPRAWLAIFVTSQHRLWRTHSETKNKAQQNLLKKQTVPVRFL